MPHPIERLRWVARAEGAGPSLLVREAAEALAAVGGDLAETVTCCRRLIDRHPSIGPLWWLGARVLAAGDPGAEAHAAADALDADPTARVLAAHLPEDATVVVVGSPEQAGEALRRRGDLAVLVVDADHRGLARRLARSGVEATAVAPPGLGGAVQAADLVLVEATALGPTGLVAAAGSLAAAAAGRGLGIGVWVVAGVGRVLPGPLWEALAGRLAAAGPPWDRKDDVAPLEWAAAVVGPAGLQPPAEALGRADCPVVPELLGWAS